MRTYTEITLQEKLNETRARMATLSRWETEKAYEIQQLIRQQADLFDDVCRLEAQLAKEKMYGRRID
jgi:hypothetical protein